MYGEAHVDAPNEKLAEQYVMNGCMGWQGDIDWQWSTVDGCEVEDAEVE
jgi:hypothetical protein